MWAHKGSDPSKERLGNQVRKNHLEPETLRTKPTFAYSGTTQRVGYPIHINPHLGKLSDQVRTAPHNTDSKNLLEHCPPQRQKHLRTNEKAMEAPTDLNKSTISSLGPTSHVNLLLDVKVISL
jgi:hypothetical protein